MGAELDEAALKCKVCGWNSAVLDTDVQTGKLAITVTWGDLIDDAGAYVQGITHYEAYLDLDGKRPTSKIGTVTAMPTGVNCCDQYKYSASDALGFPADYAGTGRVFIVPKTAGGDLPPVAVSMEIADNKGVGTTSAAFGHMFSFTALVTAIGAQMM